MEKIKKNEEFQIMYNKGQKFFGHYFLLYIKKNNLNKNRFGVVVSKKTGNAVCRVRLKRLFREIFRNNEKSFLNSYDYIFIAKRTAGEKFKELKMQELRKDIFRIFKKAGLINESFFNNNN